MAEKQPTISRDLAALFNFTDLREVKKHLDDVDLRNAEYEYITKRSKEIKDKYEAEDAESTRPVFLPAHFRPQLSRPFPKEAISSYRGNANLSTIKAAYVSERLNTVFGIGGWGVEHEFIGFAKIPKYQPENIGWGDNKKKNPDAGKVMYEKVHVMAMGRIVVYEHNYKTPWQYSAEAVGENQDFEDVLKGLVTSIMSKCAGVYLEVGIQIFKGNPDSQEANVSRRKTSEESNVPAAAAPAALVTNGPKEESAPAAEAPAANPPKQGSKAGAAKATPAPPAEQEPPAGFKKKYSSDDFNVAGLMKAHENNDEWDWVEQAMGQDPLKLPIRDAKSGQVVFIKLTTYLEAKYDFVFEEEGNDDPIEDLPQPIEFDYNSVAECASVAAAKKYNDPIIAKLSDAHKEALSKLPASIIRYETITNDDDRKFYVDIVSEMSKVKDPTKLKQDFQPKVKSVSRDKQPELFAALSSWFTFYYYAVGFKIKIPVPPKK